MSDVNRPKANTDSKQYPARKGFENQENPHHVDTKLIEEGKNKLETLQEGLSKDELRQRDIK